jgi:hypothetical protein
VWVGYDSQKTQNWIKEISDLTTIYFYLTLFPKILHRHQGKRGEKLKPRTNGGVAGFFKGCALVFIKAGTDLASKEGRHSF